MEVKNRWGIAITVSKFEICSRRGDPTKNHIRVVDIESALPENNQVTFRASHNFHFVVVFLSEECNRHFDKKIIANDSS